MTGFIYAIASDDLVKIGWSKDPWRRLVKLRSDNAGECAMLGVVPGTQADEAALHREFDAYRVRGEWFEWWGPVSDFIRSMPVCDRAVYGRRGRPGNALRDYRHAHRLTSCAVAQMVGVSQPTISRIERGRQTPSLRLAAKLAAVTNGAVTPDDFLPATERAA